MRTNRICFFIIFAPECVICIVWILRKKKEGELLFTHIYNISWQTDIWKE